MGTESEALRWKQWIDRWIKLTLVAQESQSQPTTPLTSPSATHKPPPLAESIASTTGTPQMAPSSTSTTLGTGIRKAILTPEQLQYQLINMIKEGDPVFCEGLCREIFNTTSHYRLALRCLCAFDVSEKALYFFCQVIFYLCKCPTPSVRKFLLSLVPVLVFSHLELLGSSSKQQQGGASKGAAIVLEDETEERLNSIEIALLALYQADINYQPEPASTRVPSLSSASIYHAGFKPTTLFPCNVSQSIIHPPLHLYPTVPIVRITDYTRIIVYYRLFRALQDFLPAIPEVTLVMYGLLIERHVTLATILDNPGELEAYFELQLSLLSGSASLTGSGSVGLNQSPALSVSNSSFSLATITTATVRSSHRGIESEDWRFLKRLFTQLSEQKIRLPSSVDLYLLWVDCIGFLAAKHVSLADVLKRQLLNRARAELLSQVVLALE